MKLIPLFFLITISAFADAPLYDSPTRSRYVSKSLNALLKSNIKQLENTYFYIDAVSNGNCRSEFQRLKLNCLLQAAENNCRGKPGKTSRRLCHEYSDIVVTNKLAEKRFLSAAKRYRIMKAHSEYRAQFLREIRYRYATLVTEFTLSQHYQCKKGDLDCVSKGIDSYCLEFADKRQLSWQHCTAAIVWFIGTTRS